MDDSVKDGIPYVAYESALAREERHNKRLISVILVILVLWFLTIVGCVWYISLPVEESTEISQSAETIDSSTVSQSVGD